MFPKNPSIRRFFPAGGKSWIDLISELIDAQFDFYLRANSGDVFRREPEEGMKPVLAMAAVAAIFGLGASSVGAQPIPGVPSDTAAMREHMLKAKKIAGADLFPYYSHRCLIDQTYRRTISHSIQANGAIEPEKVMDNLYFIGQNAVSAWALTTDQGIILFDTLNNA